MALAQGPIGGVLRPWRDGDLGCVEEASRDPDIPNGTTVPPEFTEAEGIAFVRRQWSRLGNGDGLGLALAGAGPIKPSAT